MNHRTRAGICLIVMMALAGCSREQSDWRSAKAADTLEAYEQFTAKHPDGELATQALARSAQLAEERDWQRVSKADTLEGYQQFIGQHPNGKWSQEARVRIENFAIASDTPATAGAPSAGAAAAGTASSAAVPSAVAAAPAKSGVATKPAVAAKSTAAVKSAVTAKPAAAAKSAGATAKPTRHAKVGAGHAIQLGAYRSKAKADAEWARLSHAHAADLGALKPQVRAVRTSSGKLYRLQAAVADDAQARTLCKKLKSHGQRCIVVRS